METQTTTPEKYRVTHTLRTDSKKYNRNGTVDPVVDISTVSEPFRGLRDAEARYAELTKTWDTHHYGKGTVLDIQIERRTDTLCGMRWTPVRSCSLNEHIMTRQ